MKTFGSRLKWARDTANLSARKLDKLAGITPGHTTAIEAGRKQDITTSTAAKLAHALGVSLDWLISGDGPRPTERSLLAKAAESGPTLEARAKAG